MKWAIQYRYPGTVNGQPVGIVYALRCDGPAFVPGTWSYSKDPEKATAFDTEEDARAEIVGRHWPEARPIPIETERR